ncbi:MAG TPA: transcriptional regulator [Desulfotomaculum sp.]|nr:transcriptional regulator [Desulfotomaculum sp.]
MPRRKRRKLKSKLRLAIFLVLLIGLFAGGFGLANNLLWPWLTGENLVAEKPDEEEEELTELPGINVLMMGVDEREDDKSQRTDTMILANVNNKDNRISLLSIPRDTKVYLPGYGVNKVNAANYYGGPEMAMQVVSDLTGVSVDYYMTTNFNGFKDIVDALGGVTVDVDKPMYHSERAYGGEYNINLQKGVQKLDGNQALMFARYRNDELGDITRTQRQLKLLSAIGDEAMKPATVTKLPKLVPGIYNNVDTNMGTKQLLAMAKAAKNLENLQMATQTLPGWFLDENGVSYWYVDPDNAREVTMALFEDGKVVDIVHGAMGNKEEQSSEGKQVAMEQPAAGSTPVADTGNNIGDTVDIQDAADAATVDPDGTSNPEQSTETDGSNLADQEFLERNGFTEDETGVVQEPDQQQVRIIIR